MKPREFLVEPSGLEVACQVSFHPVAFELVASQCDCSGTPQLKLDVLW